MKKDLVAEIAERTRRITVAAVGAEPSCNPYISASGGAIGIPCSAPVKRFRRVIA